MIKIEANHIIYSRVEPKYSPNNESGFQVVYQSPTLLQSDVDFVEKRIECFIYSDDMRLQRYLFFQTPTGLIAMGQVIPVESDAQIIDAYERSGAFIGHIILVTEPQLELINNNPFVIFHEHEHIFTRSPNDLKKYAENSSPPSYLEVANEYKLARVPSLSMSQWYELLLISSQAEIEFTNSEKSIFLKADDFEKIIDLLSVWMFLMPIEERLHCTFDSFVDSCEPQAGDFWALGGTGTRNRDFHVFDVARQHLTKTQTSIKAKETPYLQWFKAQAQATNSIPFEQITTIQQVVFCINKKRPLPNTISDEITLLSFYQVNHKYFEPVINETLTNMLHKQIAQAFQADIQKNMSLQDIFSIIATKTVNPKHLAQSLYEWLKSNQTKITQWRDVLKFAQETNFAPLQLIATFHLHSKRGPLTNILNNIEALKQKALQKIIQDQHSGRNTLVELITILSPQWIVTADTLPLLDKSFDKSLLFSFHDSVFYELVELLIKYNVSNLLDKTFIQRAMQINEPKTIRKLKKITKKSVNQLPNKFIDVVNNL